MNSLPNSENCQQVVVVGGGYAGSTVAQGLDEVADVVLVEPKDMFVHNIAALRALVDPSWLEFTLYRYDRLLRLGRVIQDRVTLVEPGALQLASGARLQADVIVLSTGSSYPFPAKYDGTDGADAKRRVQLAHAELAKSDRILIVGAGAVGIELAGEIKHVWPEKVVTVVDSAHDVLNGRFELRLRQELRRQLSSLGVDLVLGSPAQHLPSAPVGTRAAINLRTADGRSVEADIWFRCFGVSPASDYLGGSLAGARRADGFIEVDSALRVKGQAKVFALGDVSTANEHKLAAAALQQSAVVVANVRSFLHGGNLTHYRPAPEGIAIPIGPFGGAAQLPGSQELAPAEFVREMKGRDLGVDRFSAQFGYTLEQP